MHLIEGCRHAPQKVKCPVFNNLVQKTIKKKVLKLSNKL
jgi:hypothetical protein